MGGAAPRDVPLSRSMSLRRHCPHSGAHSEQTFEKGSGFLTPAEAFLTHLRCCTRSVNPAAPFSNRVKNGRRAELLGIYFFFSFFCFRFSFGLRWDFFCCSLLPLSFFPLSPISDSPCLNRDSPDGSSQPLCSTREPVDNPQGNECR